ncbi:hypothetical protein DFH09DRAFT_1366967 [Mycena vulgaris]|nr:hypothetical protein DFH09DRAFT_1366967 [Mycena vulgaris]
MDVDSGTPTRVEELWFSDGGLVVQADHSLFRVYGGLLASRSPVFKDMLAFPQPPDAETIDGCSVVRLPDSAMDVTTFFRAIFDSAFFEPIPSKTDFDTVMSILHLSNKYAVDYLQRRALVHLSSRYPTTLFSYDRSSATTSLPGSLADISRHVAAIQISREVNALWILPTAFYCLAQTEVDGIHEVFTCVSCEKHSVKLSVEDQIFFLQSSLQITRGIHDVLRFLHSSHTFPWCDGGQQCMNGRLRAIAKVDKYLAAHLYAAADPMGLCEDDDVWELLSDVCEICYDVFVKTYKEAREALWHKLPKFCDLPSWEELEKMKAEALQA